MRQNAPNPISISIFSGVTPPDPRHWELCPRTPGRGGREGEGRERGGEGKEGEGKGRGNLRHCRWAIDAPVPENRLIN